MAKLAIRDAYALFIIDTERTIDDSVYHEKWAYRSDGVILTRIVWVNAPGCGGARYSGRKDATLYPDRNYHSSTYKVWRKVKQGQTITRDNLLSLLARLGCVEV